MIFLENVQEIKPKLTILNNVSGKCPLSFGSARIYLLEFIWALPAPRFSANVTEVLVMILTDLIRHTHLLLEPPNIIFKRENRPQENKQVELAGMPRQNKQGD